MSSAPTGRPQPTTAARTPPGAGRPEQEYSPDPRRWQALAICLVAGFMSLLDVSIVNVALPSIQQGLGAGENALSWVVSGYALALGLLLVPAGRLGDARGRRPSFEVGLGLFTLASIACGFAPTATLLIVARLVQGVAGGVLTPQISGLIQSLFRGHERAKAFGLFGATVGISTAIGPLLGGGIISLFGAHSGWRYVFFVNVPIGLVALPLARKLIPHHPRMNPDAQDLDPIGVLLLGAAVTCLILPLIEQQNWHSPDRLLLYPAALVLLTTFLYWERHYRRHGHEPVVDFSLFVRRSYTLGTGVGLLYFAGFTGVFFIYTQFLQDGLGYSALHAGLALTPFALGSGAAAVLGGRIVTRYGRPLVAGGLLLVIIGLAATYLVTGAVHGSAVGPAAAGPLLVAGLGSGLVITPNVTITLTEVPVHRAGIAGGVLQTGQRIGSAAGIAATGSVFYGALAGHGQPDWALAFRHGLLVITLFVALALALALIDVLIGPGPSRRRETARADAGATAR
ncbi:MAG TPA: MFS transporter [Mycobacteriales bacterium]|nr:MFS transporter [Mycobacteriales bacterium]